MLAVPVPAAEAIDPKRDEKTAIAMFSLARLHADGRITSLDNREGLKWLLVAQRAAVQCPDNSICKNVLEDPKGYRARLEAPLSADERREARQLAEIWQPVR